MNLKELYQEIILEHGKNPRNLGKTENFNKDAKGNKNIVMEMADGNDLQKEIDLKISEAKEQGKPLDYFKEDQILIWVV